jgi:hypothetical protein
MNFGWDASAAAAAAAAAADAAAVDVDGDDISDAARPFRADCRAAVVGVSDAAAAAPLKRMFLTGGQEGLVCSSGMYLLREEVQEGKGVGGLRKRKRKRRRKLQWGQREGGMLTLLPSTWSSDRLQKQIGVSCSTAHAIVTQIHCRGLIE